MNRVKKIVSPRFWTIVLLWMGVALSGGTTLFAQCPMVCQNEVYISLDLNGQATITADIVLNTPTASCNPFTVNITDANSNGFSDTVDGSHIGANLTYTVTESGTGNACFGTLHVLDNAPPQLACDTLFVPCSSTLLPSEIGYPPANDNVTQDADIQWVYEDSFMDYDCNTSVNGIGVTAVLNRTYWATDGQGNTSSCQQAIYLERNSVLDITFPPHLDGFGAPALHCGVEDPNDLDVTGRPSIDGVPMDNASDCDIVITYFDQVAVVCGGEVKIVRNWSASDYCANQSQSYVQVIKVRDLDAPTITCPPSIVMGTDDNICGANVDLPMPTASDNCSGYTVTPSWDFGSGWQTYHDVPPGTYSVAYLAEDECGNASACSLNLTIYDDDLPVPICEEITEISLQNDGTATVLADVFDDGSTDNCQLSHFEVSRDDINFGTDVSFDCTDIPASPIALTLRVYDAVGLLNDCTVLVNVQDNLDPIITCPAATDISCVDDANELNVSDLATAIDNCDIDNIDYIDDYSSLNNCSLGTLYRIWTATDASGNTDNCIQEIQIYDATLLMLTFPPDFASDACGATSDPSYSGEPTFTGYDCEDVEVLYEDQLLGSLASGCYEVNRHWTVISWCTYDPNNGVTDGFYEHTQHLQFWDNTAPAITCPQSISTTTLSDNCETYIDLLSATATDCTPNITINNNSNFASQAGADASGNFPAGEHTITFTAADPCGNEATCSTTIYLMDAAAPTAVCATNLSFDLEQNAWQTGGVLDLQGSQVDGGSYDNCNSNTDLSFDVEPYLFDCEDRGVQEVVMTVIDADGNSSFCSTTITITDHNVTCPANSLNGKMTNANGEPVSGKYVGLSGYIYAASATDTDGTYGFEDLPAGHEYTLKPTYNVNPLDGVTTLDLVYIKQHILGVGLFDNPYKIIAADVNKSNSVTTVDIVWLRKMILTVEDEFPNNESWRFVPSNHVFEDPTNPFLTDIPNQITYPFLTNSYLHNDFVAIKVGDVNNSVSFAGDDTQERDHEMPLNQQHFVVPDLDLIAGNFYEIPIQIIDFQGIIGMQFALEYAEDALAFEALELNDLPEIKEGNFSIKNQEKNQISFSWNAFFNVELEDYTTIFTLHLKAKKDAKLSEVFGLNKEGLKPEAYKGNFLSTEQIETREVALDFVTKQQQTLYVFPCEPNPFSDQTNLPFYLPQAADVSLQIMDSRGTILSKKTTAFEQGNHALMIDMAEWTGMSGVYFYELYVPGFRRKTGKLFRLNNE